MPTAEKDRIRAIYEKDAPKYDRSMGFYERFLLGDARQWACARAEGDVLELAVGTGLNLPLYRSDVRVTGIEFSPAMLALAKQRAAELDREADLRLGDAEALEFEDASFDTVICTYALCTIPDDRKAVSEAGRVLRPGGKLVLAEHVRSPLRAVRAGQRLLEPLMVRFEADHLLREPLEHVRAEGFVVDELKRTRLGIVERLAAHKVADSAGSNI
ncbi:MAG TPA: class I SAM-dependent methyltransferase [Solirubrobacteraceae bacterium]|nr:class I SAM-dependent methyltransferase [Solirubrobacteraceae bacterium]